MQTKKNKYYKLLIVEDEKLIRKGLIDHNPWKDWGFECAGEAGNGLEAMDLLAAQNFDAIVTDIRMPIMDGITFISKIRDKGFNRPIIILSGFADFSYAQQGIKYGVFAYLLKPTKQMLIMNTFTRLRELLDTKVSTADKQDTKFISPLTEVLKYIDDNFNCDLSVAELSEIAHLSVSQLTRLFKEETGHNITNYINILRVNHSKSLLDSTQLKIYEISGFVGYNSVSYFCKVFKEIENISPREYREKVHGIN